MNININNIKYTEKIQYFNCLESKITEVGYSKADI
jgi:hypothetical protein